MSVEYIKKEDVLKFIQDIKCNSDIPKNYGTLLDITRYIRKMPTYDVGKVLEQIDGIMKDESIRFCDQAVNVAKKIVKSGGVSDD